MTALLARGDRVTDSLTVDRRLGEGAFAEVYRVEHAFLGWQAMKVFKQVATLPATRALLGEARLLSTLGHRNIVRLFDAGTVQTANGVHGWFTMEYVAGGSLERLVDSYRHAVPVPVVVEAVEQIADGLTLAHEQDPPVLHRDLTPANVLVGYDAAGIRVRISDFGLAKRADPLTQLASAQGTYAFMAPEVLRNEGYSRAGDLFALGSLAYLMLTNVLPYDDGRRFSSMSLARFDRPLLPPSGFNDGVDAELDRIVTGTLAVRPADRPASARALRHDLRTWRARQEQDAPADPVPHTLPDAGTPVAEPETPETAERARRLADEALALARRPSGLTRAADLMEEAVSLSPRLREVYLPRLTLWRRQVMM